jgi:hypothetical protein
MFMASKRQVLAEAAVCGGQTFGLSVMSDAELKSDLVRDLAFAEEARKKRFAAIIRLVRRYEATGPAKDMMAQIRRDHQLCKLLVDYESVSEVIGMMEFVRDLQK